jgi:hypothetical protein
MLLITATNLFGSTGLTKCGSNPASWIRRSLSSSLRAVTATRTGGGPPSCSRNRTANSSPSISGIFKSIRHTHGCSLESRPLTSGDSWHDFLFSSDRWAAWSAYNSLSRANGRRAALFVPAVLLSDGRSAGSFWLAVQLRTWLNSWPPFRHVMAGKLRGRGGTRGRAPRLPEAVGHYEPLFKENTHRGRT